MNDDGLVDLLGSLRTERMGRAADARARQRLENEWADLDERRATSWLQRLAPAVIGVSFAALVLFTTLHAPGDSPLYGVRAAVEDAWANVYSDPQGRIAYLMDLYEQRQAEAARLETTGNAASAGARRIEQRTLAMLQALLPQAPDAESSPAPAATPQPPSTTAPAVVPSVAPTASPTSSPGSPTPPPPTTPRPTPTLAPTPTQAPTLRPTPTLTPKPATPTPTKEPVVLNGTVVDATGAPAIEACVSVTVGDCAVRTTTGGVYRLSVAASLGQNVTVYAWTSDASGKITYKGYVTVTIKSKTVQVPTITLRPY